MSKTWRPEGWDALDIYATAEHIGMTGTDLIEAGADAMYQPAYDQGKDDGKAELLAEMRAHPDATLTIPGDSPVKIQVQTGGVSFSFTIHTKGILVFIPNDKEGK